MAKVPRDSQRLEDTGSHRAANLRMREVLDSNEVGSLTDQTGVGEDVPISLQVRRRHGTFEIYQHVLPRERGPSRKRTGKQLSWPLSKLKTDPAQLDCSSDVCLHGKPVDATPHHLKGALGRTVTSCRGTVEIFEEESLPRSARSIVTVWNDDHPG